MKAKHHFWSSLAAGSALYWVTGSSAALVGAMVGGFAIDADHAIDQIWSIRHGARLRRGGRAKGLADKQGTTDRRGWWSSLLSPRELVRLPLIFHSYELLAVITFLTLNLRLPFLIGLSAGYILHLTLDMVRHHHEFRSRLFYLFSYRLALKFRRDQLIKPEYL